MRFFIITILLLSASEGYTQRISSHRYLEAGVIMGFNNYSGDVAESVVELSETTIGFGVFARYHFSSHFALKTQFYTANISGTDANARDPELKARSLQFKSNLLEIVLAGEWNILNVKPLERNGLRKFRIVPYLSLGIGAVFMHPTVKYFGPPNEFNKQVPYPLPENGLFKKALMIPVGGGFRSQITDRITLGIEGGWRPVFSDYLDGVSLNGNPKYKDWYYTAIATLSFALTQ